MRKEVPMGGNSWLENVLECIGSAMVIALALLGLWLFCVATPGRSSAEADMERGNGGGAAAMQDGLD